MLEIIVMVVVLFVTWLVGAVQGWQAHERMVRRNLRHAIHEFEEHINETHIKIKIEKHNGMLFVYNYDTNAFMAQGTNRVEIEKQLQEKFPNKKFAAETSQIALFGAD
jgi:ribonuclease HIII